MKLNLLLKLLFPKIFIKYKPESKFLVFISKSFKSVNKSSNTIFPKLSIIEIEISLSITNEDFIRM